MPAPRSTRTAPYPPGREPASPQETKDRGFYDGFLPYVLASIVHQLHLDLLADLKKYKISLSRWRVLAVLGVREGRTINEIAELAMIRQSALSRAVVQMEANGLIRRESMKGDQRFVLVYLTAKGRQLFQKLFPIVERRQEICLAGIAPKDAKQLFALLHQVQGNLKDRRQAG